MLLPPWLLGRRFCYTEEFSSFLPPAELLSRVAGRTAPATVSTWAGLETTAARYGTQHWFVGTIAPKGHFALELLDPRGWGRFWQLTSLPAPRLEGWVTTAPDDSGGSRLRIRYQESPYAPLLALLAAGAVGQRILASNIPWPLALLLAGAAVPVARLLQRGSLRLAAGRHRDCLVELTPLRIVAAATIVAG